MPAAGCAISHGWQAAIRRCGAMSVLPTAMRCAAIWRLIAMNSDTSTRCWRRPTAPGSCACSSARAPPVAAGSTARAAATKSSRPLPPATFAMDHLDLGPVARMAGTVELPGSKSISNRTLLLAALARGTTELVGLLDADDVAIMLAALRTLGVEIDRRVGARTVAVHGAGGRFAVRHARLSLGNAGTALRPL